MKTTQDKAGFFERIRKGITAFKTNTNLPAYPSLLEIEKERETMHKLLDQTLKTLKLQTPRPSAGELWEETPEAAIRLPRIPFDLSFLYLLRFESVVLRTVVKDLTQEIFRETLKEGWEFRPKFKVKCRGCHREFNKKIDRCPYCRGPTFPPDPEQQRTWKNFTKICNDSKQSYLAVCQETNNDLETVDDLFQILRREFIITGERTLLSRVVEILRGDPITMRIVADETGRRGGLYWCCPIHRESVSVSPGFCDHYDSQTNKVCSLQRKDVHYVEVERGGTSPIAYFFEDEVIHTVKYEQSRLYGFPPIYTLWVIGRTLMLMEQFVQQAYAKGRLRGILGIAAHADYVDKWWDETHERLAANPHYQPVIALEGEQFGKSGKRMEFVKFMDSLQEMQYTPAQELMARRIGALYGVSPIFQNDVSTGTGLTNEGLQVTVTDRSVDFGQAVFHNAVFPQLCDYLGITDWEIRLRPSREVDRMAELQQVHQKTQTAQIMNDMGFGIKIIEGDDGEIAFEFTDEPVHPAGGTGLGYPQIPQGSGEERPKPEDQQRPDLQQPDNRLGQKHCPEGMVATPENPRCHPLEWEFKNSTKAEDNENYLVVKCKESTFQKELEESRNPNYNLFWTLNKVEKFGDPLKAQKLVFATEKGVRGHFSVQGFGKEKYQGKEQAVVYFKRDFQPFTKECCPELEQETAKKLADLVKADKARYFDLIRNKDESGISGTGHVGSGVIFPDGEVVFRWLTENASTSVFEDFKTFKAIHVDPHPENKSEIRYYNLDISVTKSELLKNADMMAHVICMLKKLKKLGYQKPEEVKTWRDGIAWIRELKGKDKRVEEANEICDDQGKFKPFRENPERDPDYPHPYSEKEEDAIVSQYFSKEQKKALESKTEVLEEKAESEEEFQENLTAQYEKDFKRLENIKNNDKKELISEVNNLVKNIVSRLEKDAFKEVLRAYAEGKETVKDLAKMAPAFSTSGGKARMARRLKSIIPVHKISNEPLAGAGALFLKKDPSEKEYLNDKDAEVMKIWQILKEGSDKAFKYLASQNWSADKAHWQKLKAQNPEELSDLERAYRKIYLRRYSNHSKEEGFRSDNKDLGAPFWLKNQAAFTKYSERLQNAQLSNLDWKDITLKVDSPDTFHFIDPPYSEEFAKELCEFLPRLKGKWLVTFADNQTLKAFFKEKCHEIKVKANANFWNVPSDSTRKELLIANYPIRVPSDTLFKWISSPAPFSFAKLPFSRSDIDVLRAIYKHSPFWTAFSGLSESIGDKLKSIITESYVAPTEKQFLDEFSKVKEQYPDRPLRQQQNITYNRIGKFSLPKTIKEMKKVVNAEAYRLERIARTETTAISAKGREVAWMERDKGEFRYDWVGPQDRFTSDECTWIKAEIAKIGKGLGVTMKQIKDIFKRCHQKFHIAKGSKFQFREWLPHINCRHVIRRVS